uniref:Secreted protein n=1 Tax=Parascaris univalens TaxID=6257 RepID=A0A914ZLQ8_PARUN
TICIHICSLLHFTLVIIVRIIGIMFQELGDHLSDFGHEWYDILWTTEYKRLNCLNTRLSEFIVLGGNGECDKQRDHKWEMWCESASCTFAHTLYRLYQCTYLRY